MKQNDRDLLLKDLCARLQYGVMCYFGLGHPLPLQRIFVDRLDGILLDFYEDGNHYQVYLSEVKPYLHPMSSMTAKEREEYDSYRKHLCDEYNRYCFDSVESIDWLNAHHFDYRGLIEKGLALKAPEGMY